jgi:hypothetical protein
MGTLAVMSVGALMPLIGPLAFGAVVFVVALGGYIPSSARTHR